MNGMEMMFANLMKGMMERPDMKANVQKIVGFVETVDKRMASIEGMTHDALQYAMRTEAMVRDIHALTISDEAATTGVQPASDEEAQTFLAFQRGELADAS